MQSQVSSDVTLRAGLISANITKPLHLISALVLGVVIIYGAGFAQSQVAHSAAHDMRHSQGFPCH